MTLSRNFILGSCTDSSMMTHVERTIIRGKASAASCVKPVTSQGTLFVLVGTKMAANPYKEKQMTRNAPV